MMVTTLDIPAIPVGTITPYGGASAPTGWLLCDGTAVSRTTYAALFAALSDAFGVGDGSTTFNLPDLRGRFPLGKATSGTGSTLGGMGGAGTIDVTSTSGEATTNVVTTAGTFATRPSGHTHAYTPPFQAVNFIIKI